MTSEQLTKKIAHLNRTVFAIMGEEDNDLIIKILAKEGKNIFEADYAVAWGKFKTGSEYGLVFRSDRAPEYFKKVPIKEKANELVIPINYFDHSYGNITVGFKGGHKISEHEVALGEMLGNVAAESVTINWLAENQIQALTLAEKQRETELLLEEEKSKTEFIANATHELRTPLSIMRGYVDLALRDKKNQKKAVEALKAVREEIIHLAAMFSDLVFVAADNNRRQPLISKVDVGKLIKRISVRLKNLAKDKNIKINMCSSGKTIIAGEEKYLERLFLNLIENAIIYGGTKIEAGCKRDKDQVRVIIRDDGAGISKEDLPKIFERFYRADKAHTNYGKHSGLGLSIVKSIVDMHGGSIKVESKLGKGSTFTVTLPLKLRNN